MYKRSILPFFIFRENIIIKKWFDCQLIGNICSVVLDGSQTPGEVSRLDRGVQRDEPENVLSEVEEAEDDPVSQPAKSSIIILILKIIFLINVFL